ncbi:MULTISPECIES: hypothetical protein [Herbaspirillum]|uniref:Uncharacterized protein n=2 Tax=Herbaspirillum huttiense TaxID=863372 RepID=A0AAJ2H788_9BURK|nr:MULTISPECIES: hypothetical protein [Herbaspirillum]MDR9836873.1 hypothetical protein [Herbaspirillum huttiense]
MFLQAFLLHSVQYAYWLALALITFGFLQRIHQKRFVSIPGKILASLGALLLTISADGLFGSIAVAAQLFADLVPERSLGGYQVTSIFPAFGPFFGSLALLAGVMLYFSGTQLRVFTTSGEESNRERHEAPLDSWRRNVPEFSTTGQVKTIHRIQWKDGRLVPTLLITWISDGSNKLMILGDLKNVTRGTAIKRNKRGDIQFGNMPSVHREFADTSLMFKLQNMFK